MYKGFANSNSNNSKMQYMGGYPKIKKEKRSKVVSRRYR